MFEHYYAVIMAGGGGTRLWPLSRQSRPKQMLRLFGDSTLFETAVKRLEGVFSPDHVLVVTVAEQAQELRQECPEIPEDNYIIEALTNAHSIRDRYTILRDGLSVEKATELAKSTGVIE